MKIVPLPIEYIVRENYNYNILQVIFNNLQMKTEFENFELKKRIMFSSVSLLNTYNHTFKSSKDSLYTFILQLGMTVEKYHNNSSFIKQIIDGINKKRVTLHIITKGSGIIKIIIFPWRTVIQTDNSAFDYHQNEKEKITEHFCKTLFNIINTNCNVIVAIHVTSNISTFKDIKSIDSF